MDKSGAKYTYSRGRFGAGILRNRKGTVTARFPVFEEGLTFLCWHSDRFRKLRAVEIKEGLNGSK